jgi:hypothetical protein
MTTETANPYQEAFYGYFKGIKSWDDLTAFWQHLEQHADDSWFVYETNQLPPGSPLPSQAFIDFIQQADDYLRKNHDEDYCGIVYVDDPESPEFIKIYDPNNLGVVCGYSDNPPLPKWSVSRLRPVDLNAADTDKKGWKKWLGNMFSTSQ